MIPLSVFILYLFVRINNNVCSCGHHNFLLIIIIYTALIEIFTCLERKSITNIIIIVKRKISETKKNSESRSTDRDFGSVFQFQKYFLSGNV